jgi:hypothetical protein
LLSKHFIKLWRKIWYGSILKIMVNTSSYSHQKEVNLNHTQLKLFQYAAIMKIKVNKLTFSLSLLTMSSELHVKSISYTF